MQDHTLAVFNYPKNLTLFDTEYKKVLGSSLLVVRFDYDVWCATFDLNTGVNTGVNYFNPSLE